MDVWLDGARVGAALAKCGSAGADVSLAHFNFTSKGNFVARFTWTTSRKTPPVCADHRTDWPRRDGQRWRCQSHLEPRQWPIAYTVNRARQQWPLQHHRLGLGLGGSHLIPTRPSIPAPTIRRHRQSPSSTSGNSNQASATVVAPIASRLRRPAQSSRILEAWLTWTPVTGSSRATGYTSSGHTSGGPYTSVATGLSTPLFLIPASPCHHLRTTLSPAQLADEAPTPRRSRSPRRRPAGGTPASWKIGSRCNKGGWFATQVMAASRLARDDKNPSSHYRAAARVEVRPGDDPIGSTGERSEVVRTFGISSLLQPPQRHAVLRDEL